MAAGVRAKDKERRDACDDDADDDEHQQWIGEAWSLFRWSRVRGHGWLDAVRNRRVAKLRGPEILRAKV
jgi:hypothetical protein